MIRLPEFVSKEEFEWAICEATQKKQQDFSKVQFFTYKEGICAQCMHIGSYDDEPATIRQMEDFIREKGYMTEHGLRNALIKAADACYEKTQSMK